MMNLSQDYSDLPQCQPYEHIYRKSYEFQEHGPYTRSPLPVKTL